MALSLSSPLIDGALASSAFTDSSRFRAASDFAVAPFGGDGSRGILSTVESGLKGETVFRPEAESYLVCFQGRNCL